MIMSMTNNKTLLTDVREIMKSNASEFLRNLEDMLINTTKYLKDFIIILIRKKCFLIYIYLLY